MIRTTVTQTRAGAVQGYFTGQCLLFAGTLYAAPPSGEWRFRPLESLTI
jgi:carboxylesterase type B